MGLTPSIGTPVRLVVAIVRPILRLQTYKNLLYLVLSFPLGLFYGAFLGFGLIFGIVLSVVGVGVLILTVVVLLVHPLSGFERWLSNRLLAVDLNEFDEDLPQTPFRESVSAHLAADSTWRGLGFLTLKLWFGIVGLVLLFGFTTAYSLITSLQSRPRAIEFGEVNGEPVIWTVETAPEAAAAAAGGVAVVVFLLHLTSLFGYVAGRVSASLLGE